jgi:serine/threonine-protein kinase
VDGVSVDGRFSRGEVLAGYVVEELVGRGGMGEVYRALDQRLERPVALKLLAPRLADDPGFRDRLLRESRLAASLDHPNVVPIYETGESEGRLFIAMRYVEGTDLKTLLRRDGTLSPERACALAGQVGDALDAAHARGLVHRDVKPSNVLIDEQGGREHCYLADFGLTQSASESGPADGQLMGTLEYVAPEQIRGEVVDGRADVYALGCLLFEALTGTLPFAGASDVALIYSHLEEAPPRASDRRPDLPEAADDVLARAMAKDPDARQQSCRALVAELEDALGLRPSRRDMVRRRLPLVATALALLATVVAVIVVLASQAADPAAAAPTGSVIRIDPATNAVSGRFTLGPDPGPIAAAAGRVWVVSRREGELWLVDPSSGEVRRPGGPGSPRDLAALGDTIYVISAGSDFSLGALTPYDASTGQRREGIPALDCSIAAGAGFGIAASVCPTVQRIVDRAGRLTVTWETLIPFPEPRTADNARTCQCDMSVVGRELWVAGDPTDPRVWRLDGRGRIVAAITIPFGVRSVAADAAGVWVTGSLDDRVARIDPGTNRVTDTLPTGRGARGVAVGAGGVWVANSIDGTVTRIDPVSRRAVATVRTGGRPAEVTVGDGAVWVTVDDG